MAGKTVETFTDGALVAWYLSPRFDSAETSYALRNDIHAVMVRRGLLHDRPFPHGPLLTELGCSAATLTDK